MDGAQRGCDFAVTAIQPGTADDFFVFRENITAHAQLRIGVLDGQQEYLCGRSLRTEQGRDQDVDAPASRNRLLDAGGTAALLERGIALP